MIVEKARVMPGCFFQLLDQLKIIMTTIDKPFETYFGGKEASGSYQQVINQIRPHDVYMELCVGNGTVFRYLRRAGLTYLNDFNAQIIEAWRNICSDDTIVFTISNVIDFLKSFTFEPHLRYCLYLDPPYPHCCRKSLHRYPFEMTDEEHRELLRVIKTLPVNVDVLISTYENEIYAAELKDWRLLTYNSMTRGGVAVEYLYMNYENPEGLLHDYRYLGVDNTDRQRIKRKIDRKVRQLQELPAAERNAIINAVVQLATGGQTLPSLSAMVDGNDSEIFES